MNKIMRDLIQINVNKPALEMVAGKMLMANLLQ